MSNSTLRRWLCNGLILLCVDVNKFDFVLVTNLKWISSLFSHSLRSEEAIVTGIIVTFLVLRTSSINIKNTILTYVLSKRGIAGHREIDRQREKENLQCRIIAMHKRTRVETKNLQILFEKLS